MLASDRDVPGGRFSMCSAGGSIKPNTDLLGEFMEIRRLISADLQSAGTKKKIATHLASILQKPFGHREHLNTKGGLLQPALSRLPPNSPAVVALLDPAVWIKGYTLDDLRNFSHT
jgi:hypothetical protein